MAAAVGLIGVIGIATWRGSQVPPNGIHAGKADIGGAFSLNNHHGETITDQSFRGRPFVIYFGWSRDPDLTPAALQVLTAALEKLGPKSEAITPLFVSLDPERDKTADLQGFLQRFHPRLVGLIGTPDQTLALARSYKLYFRRIPDASLPGGYSIDHASLYYVMGSDGDFRGLVPHTTDSAALAAQILNLAK